MKKFLTTLLLLALALTSATGFSLAETTHEPITLTMFSMPANTSGLMEGEWWTDYLYDELGITIELLPAGDNDEMRMQALLAADALPDIVVFEGMTYLRNAIVADMLVCLDDYADQMPNAQKYMKEAMAYNAENVSDDGKAYAIANDVGDVVRTGRLNYTTSIRWDIYQEIGAPEIKTAWDYLDVLKQMQDAHPTNEEGQKVYAITAWSDWDGYNMANAQYFSLHNGIDCGDIIGSSLPLSCLDLETLELSCALEPDSGYIDGLKFLFTANQMGLLDPDSMTQTWSNACEKSSAGRTLFTWWLWAAKYNTAEHTNADEPTGFEPVLPTDSKAPLACNNPVGSNWCWAISAKSEHIDRCIEYLDFMCNPDKLFVLSNGPQGETWDLNDEGKPYLTEKGIAVNSGEIEELSAGGTLSAGIGTINSRPLQTGTVSELYGATIAYSDWETYEPTRTKLDEWYISETGYEYPVDTILTKDSYLEIPLATKLVAPLSDDMQIIATQIGDVVRTQSWMAVYAADEAEFNQLVSDMYEAAKELGIDDLMEYNQTQWNAACELAARYE